MPDKDRDKEFRRYMFQMATLAALSVMLTVGGFMAIVIVMVPK